MKFKPIILMLTIILLSSFSSSELIIETYTTDFFTEAKLNPEVCICGELTDNIKIRNEAPYPQVFTLTTNIEEAQISNTQITVLPKKELTVPVLISVECDERPTQKLYEVKIRSTTGQEQIISRNLQIKNCQTIQAELYADKQEIKICEKITYTVLLENPSTLTEKYVVGPLRNVEFFDEKGYEVELRPNQKSIMNFTFTPPCEISGDFKNEFRIQTTKTKLTADLTHELFIKPRYEFSIIGEQDIKTCKHEVTRIYYEIKNEGLTTNNYEVSIKKNPSFAEINQTTLTLKPNETQKIYLELKPARNAKENYEFEIHTKTTIGQEQAIKKINLTIKDCYDTSLTIKSPETLRVCQGHQELVVNIKNKGTKIEEYTLETNTPRAKLQETQITLEPNQEKNINLEIDSTLFKDKILFQVSAHSKRELLKHWEDSIVLDIVPRYECSKIIFSRTNIYSRHDEKQITITLKNTGIQDGSYNISYKGSDFLELITQELNISKNEKKDIILNKTRTHEQKEYYFSINITNQIGENYEKEFRLKITKTPLTEQIIEYSKQNPCFLAGLTIVIITLITLLLVISKIITIKPRTKIITSIIILAIIILLFLNHGLPQKVNPDLKQPQDPYSFKIYENKELTIDLKNFVIDPDNDTLTFTIEDEPTHINLSLQENILKIKAENWTGNDRFKITASDGRGGEVTTPRFNIETVPLKKLTNQELYEYYCPHLNIILLIILSIIILLSGTKKRKQKNDQKNKTISKKNKTKKTKNKK